MTSRISIAVCVANCDSESKLDTCVYMAKMGVLQLSYSDSKHNATTQPEYDVQLGYTSLTPLS